MKYPERTIRSTNTTRFLLLAALLVLLRGHAALAQRIDAVDPDRLRIAFVSHTNTCVPVGAADTIVFSVTNQGDRAVTIEQYQLKKGNIPSPFILPATTGAVLQRGESRNDAIIFRPLVAGDDSATVEIKLASGGGALFEVQDFASRAANLIIPDSIIFDLTGNNQPIDRCVFLFNPSCQPITITKIHVDPPFVLVAPTSTPIVVPGTNSPPPPPTVLCIRYLPDGSTDARGKVEIETGTENVSVELHAAYRQNLPVDVDPGRLDFDSIPVYAVSPPLTGIVVNHGIQNDTITAWELVGHDTDEFIIDAPPIPAVISGRGRDTALFRVRFAPRFVGPSTAALIIHVARLRDPIALNLSGTSYREGVHAAPREIDFGAVAVGTTKTLRDTIVLHNSWPDPDQVVQIDFDGPDRSRFTVTGPSPADIGPPPDPRYTVTFTPDAMRDFDAGVLFRLRNGIVIPVRLRGHGDVHTIEPHRVMIDSTRADADVNVPFPLVVHVQPELTAANDVTRFLLVLRVDHRALFPLPPTTIPGAHDTIYYRSADTVIFERLDGPPITGRDLTTLNLMGLVTGQELDTVTFVAAQFPERDSVETAGDGHIRLTGCDVGSGLGFGRPVAAHAAWPVPAQGSVTISYLAEQGSRPWVRVVDVMGCGLRETTLPDGTGSEQQTTVTTEGLGAGMYFVELHAGGEQSVVRVIVER